MDENQSLAKIGENNVESLKTVANNLKSYVETEDDTVLLSVTKELNRRPGLFGIMFPGKVLKANEELTVQKMKDMYKTRFDLLQPYITAQIELTKNQGQLLIRRKLQGYEKELSQEAMQIRTELTAFSQMKIQEMSDTFQKSRTIFADRMDQQIKDSEKYKDNDFLYTRLMNNLEKETEMFFNTIDELLSGFTEALKNKLNQN